MRRCKTRSSLKSFRTKKIFISGTKIQNFPSNSGLKPKFSIEQWTKIQNVFFEQSSTTMKLSVEAQMEKMISVLLQKSNFLRRGVSMLIGFFLALPLCGYHRTICYGRYIFIEGSYIFLGKKEDSGRKVIPNNIKIHWFTFMFNFFNRFTNCEFFSDFSGQSTVSSYVFCFRKMFKCNGVVSLGSENIHFKKQLSHQKPFLLSKKLVLWNK